MSVAPTSSDSSVRVTVGRPVARVRICDRAERNRITPRLCAELPAALREAAAHPATRAVLLSGEPEVFCAGGTQDELLGFHQGRSVLEAEECITAPLNCPVPVVAAIRGHAIGGGLLLGLYADLAVLSERSVYAANFMAYGFTPGVGATALLPARFGAVLGTEMLLTGRSFRGAELRRRGVPYQVVAHDLVESAARELAVRTARAPLPSLRLLKQHLSTRLRSATDEVLGPELRMQAVTFALPEVAARITQAYRPPD
jgi:polyketide biosynthesis enoyl-CoA hydratase PksI